MRAVRIHAQVEKKHKDLRFRAEGQYGSSTLGPSLSGNPYMSCTPLRSLAWQATHCL